MNGVKMYGATWCGDTKRARKYLEDHDIPYEWHDVDEDERANGYVLEVSDGKRIVPVIRFDDGSILVEPSNDELESKLEG